MNMHKTESEQKVCKGDFLKTGFNAVIKADPRDSLCWNGTA